MTPLQEVSILNLMPLNLANDPNVRMMAQAFDSALREIIAKIPGVSIYPRIREITDHLLLDLLAWQFHVDFYNPEPPMSIEVKRELVMKSIDWHSRKGTPSAPEEAITAAIAETIITEWFEYGGAPYCFKLSVDGRVDSYVTFKGLIDALFTLKNTRSWLERIVYERESSAHVYIGPVIQHKRSFHIPADHKTAVKPMTARIGIVLRHTRKFVIPGEAVKPWHISQAVS